MDTRLQRVIAEVLGIPAERVHAHLRREDVTEWDSLNHLRLITAIESELGAAFTMEQIAAVSTIGDLERALGRPAEDGFSSGASR